MELNCSTLVGSCSSVRARLERLACLVPCCILALMFIYQPDKASISAFIGSVAAGLSGKVLDVGAGDGNRYRHFFDHCQYITLDCQAGLNPDIVAFADHIPLPDASVDNILCIETFVKLFNMDDVAREFARVLKPGGRLVATASFLSAFCGDAIDYWRFTPNSIHKLFDPYFETTCVWRGGFFQHMLQDSIKFVSIQFNLYNHRYAGTIVSIIAAQLGKLAVHLDGKKPSQFAMGCNIVARKRGTQVSQ